MRKSLHDIHGGFSSKPCLSTGVVGIVNASCSRVFLIELQGVCSSRVDEELDRFNEQMVGTLPMKTWKHHTTIYNCSYNWAISIFHLVHWFSGPLGDGHTNLQGETMGFGGTLSGKPILLEGFGLGSRFKPRKTQRFWSFRVRKHFCFRVSQVWSTQIHWKPGRSNPFVVEILKYGDPMRMLIHPILFEIWTSNPPLMPCIFPFCLWPQESRNPQNWTNFQANPTFFLSM